MLPPWPSCLQGLGVLEEVDRWMPGWGRPLEDLTPGSGAA